MKIARSIVAVLAVAAIATATSAEPVRRLLPPDVKDVVIDANGRAVMLTADGDWRATAEAVFAGTGNSIGGATVLLIDKQRRIWLQPNDDAAKTSVHLYDGKSWLTRTVADIPASLIRKLDNIQFLPQVIQDAAGNVWLVDGHSSQGWWLHQCAPDGTWSVNILHERTLQPSGKSKVKPAVVYAEPQLQVGPDGLFYADWHASRADKGPGLGPSGFVQFDGSRWTEYFYPVGSNQTDNVQGIIPLPDGSVGFLRTIDEPRVVWMTSALSRPVPDLTRTLERLASLSSREREAAQAELIAMGPRIRKALESLAGQTDDPEIKSRIPVILQEISRTPPKGIYGGRLTFTSWKPLYQAKSGRVYLAVKNCIDKQTGREYREALVTINPDGVWSAEDSPTARFDKSIGLLEVCEDRRGRRWDRIAGEGIFLNDPAIKLGTIAASNDSLGRLIGCDSDDKLYVRTKDGIVVFNPNGTAP